MRMKRIANHAALQTIGYVIGGMTNAFFQRLQEERIAAVATIADGKRQRRNAAAPTFTNTA